MTSTQPKPVELDQRPRKISCVFPHTFLTTFLKYNQKGARELKSIIKENISAHIVKVPYSINFYRDSFYSHLIK